MPRQLVFELGHRAASGREDFLVAPSNEAAVRLVDAWPDWPSHAVAISGPSGSGKTHLAEVWRAASGAITVEAATLATADIPALVSARAIIVENLGALDDAGERALFHLLNLVKEEGASLLITSREPPARLPTRLPDLSSRLKALPYLDNLLAREEARARGADEALLLDTSGHLACASVANVFLWEKDRLVTPAEECGILPGVTRAAILELSERLGIDAVEDMIAPQRLQSADGAFLTNSLIGIMPLSRIDRRELPAHRLTGRLQAAYDLLLDADEEEGLDTLPED
nr:hypothetical protein DBT41_10250 [Aerococcus urinae]